MKFLFDIFPILLFFIVYKFFGIYTATGVAIAASLLQIGFVFALGKKIEYTMWVNLIVISLFGGMTLIFHNEIFIKWKPTILYLTFALSLLISDLYFKKNLLKTLMREGLELPEKVWRGMNSAWILFFSLLAAVNLIVAYTFSTDTWVNFKLFGLIGLTIIFIVVQSFFIARYVTIKEQ
jgi:intracellular septation protein